MADRARVIGAETEYGIVTPTQPALSPIVSSTHAVVAYALAHNRSQVAPRWDFSEESPLRDSRGFDLRRYHTVPSIDPHAIGVANAMLGNGGRFYVDHAHPEYSAPEVTSAVDAARYDAAGDLFLLRAAALLKEYEATGKSVLKGHDPCGEVKFYKNNVDGKGASYGAHENYSYHRGTPFDQLAASLIPFFVARQVFIGAGRVGKGPRGERPGFQISQRADYIEQEISLETTMNRGIINTRDESHTTEDFARLHVIIGDANMSHTSMLLKYGMTSLVLDAIEQGVDFSDLSIKNPVAEVTGVSYDPTLQHRLTLADGTQKTALEILDVYRQRVEAHSEDEQRVLDTWDQVREALEEGPLAAAHLLDWCAKYALVRNYMARGVAEDDPKLALIDLQYCDIDPAKSLYHALVRNKRMRTLFSDEQLQQAAAQPPRSTRAWMRGHAVSHLDVQAASWERLTIGNTTVRIASLLHPNAQDCQAIDFQAQPDAEALLGVEGVEAIEPSGEGLH